MEKALGSFRVILAISLLFLVVETSVGNVAAAQLNVQRRSSTYVGFLKTQGQWFVDAQGSVVILRGANFFGYEYGLLSSHTEADYQKMASWGFNVVRLPVAWNLIEPKPGVYDESYLSYVDRDLGWAKRYGLHVILDMHQYCWSPYFTYCDAWHTAGIPSWAVSAYPNTAEGEAHAKADFWNGLGPNGTAASGASPSMQDRFVQMWKYVANRYESEPAIAAFDLFNEPTVVSQDLSGQVIYFYDPGVFCSSTVPVFFTRVVDVIRTVDDRHILVWEPAENCIWNLSRPLSEITSPVARPNVAYSPHYPGVGDAMTLSGGYSGDRNRLEKAFENGVLRPSSDWKQPVFIGEWGILADARNVTSYIRDFSDLLDKYVMSAAWWTYGSSTGEMNLQDQNGNDRTILTQNLVRPYVGMASAVLSYSSLNTNIKELEIGLLGPCTMNVYAPPFRDLAKVNADGGSASAYWAAQNVVVTVSVASGADVVTIQFA